jgi:glutamine---fructose-6-phosphate transaminase (isomerizing)
MRTELAESPDVVERLLVDARPGVEAIAAAVRQRDVDVVVIAARGTSDHAAVYAQYVLGARNGLVVAPATPSLSSVYRTPPRFDRALVLGISQSGRSPDVVAVLADARRQGALTVAMTNDSASELARAADSRSDLGAGPELAIAATKTYLAEVAAVAMLSAALSGGDAFAQLAAVPHVMRVALELEDDVAAAAQTLADDDACVVLARGYQYATAREWALKLKEVTGLLADPYSVADFQHGPIALVEAGFPVLGVATSGPALAGEIELLERLGNRGARLIVLSDAADALALGAGVQLPDVPEWLSPLVAILPAQLFAYHLALARGLDPDAPRNLTKVTRTT